jgi:hypothetical protein
MKKHTIYSRAAVDALVSINKSNKPDGEKGVSSDDEFEYFFACSNDNSFFSSSNQDLSSGTGIYNLKNYNQLNLGYSHACTLKSYLR